MTFKICGRRGGKTTSILRAAADNPRACIIVPTKEIAVMTIRTYPVLADRVFTVREVRDGRLDSRAFDTIHIDNLDLMLYDLLGLTGLPSFGVITATGNLDLSRNPFLGECK